MVEPVRDVHVRQDGIRLGQLLKLAGLVESGADAKAVLAAGAVTVGGRPESRRGRQLRAGDVVALGGTRVRVAVSDPVARGAGEQTPPQGGSGPA